MSRLWDRSLDHYPERGPRIMYLSIVVVVTILLYYQLYVGGAVATTILVHYGMTFRYYLYGVGVFAGIAGAFFSLVAGLGDRWGRANMVTYGVLIATILVLFIPSMPTKFWYIFLVACIGAVEGVVLVATPALVRDFSPQLNRASAMGFWTLGPVAGSLVAAIVSSNTLSHLHAWQDQFTISGIAGLGVFLVALVWLRELSPNLRDQLMVSMRDRVLVEARARGIDIEAALRRPWRQMIKWDLIVPGFGIAVLLLFYYAMVSFLVIYMAAMYGWTTRSADFLGDWFWAFDCGGLLIIGVVSDKLRVRKPFMVFGAVVAVVMTYLFLSRAGHPTSFTTFVVILSVLAVGLAFAYAPAFAAYTETAEKHNPALLATGLAVWGWILRAVVTVSALVIPIVVSSVTPIVSYGARVAVLSAKYKTQLATAAAVPPKTLAALTKNPSTSSALSTAVSDISAKLHVTSGKAVTRLIALGAAAKTATFQYLEAHGPAVTKALKEQSSQWQHWWWVCIAGELVFIPTVFMLVGRWSPADAKRDAEEHERLVEAELARLHTPAMDPPEPLVTA